MEETIREKCDNKFQPCARRAFYDTKIQKDWWDTGLDKAIYCGKMEHPLEAYTN